MIFMPNHIHSFLDKSNEYIFGLRPTNSSNKTPEVRP